MRRPALVSGMEKKTQPPQGVKLLTVAAASRGERQSAPGAEALCEGPSPHPQTRLRPRLLAVLFSLRGKTEARLRPRLLAVLLSLRNSRSPPLIVGSSRIG